MENEKNYLPYLINAVPEKGYGNRLSMYLIALEAWRRGLKIKFFVIDNPENKMLIRYSIGDGKKEYRFESSLGEKLATDAYNICENKDETKKILSQADFPVPEGKRFMPDVQTDVIIEYANTLGYPVVIKPISENAGKGVFSNIKTSEELESSLQHLRNELGYKDMIVEKHIVGTEHRMFIVDGKFIGAINRIPANIVGNGVNTIEELIEFKNNSKRDNPTLSTKNIEKDKEVTDSIKALGYEYTSVPKNDEQIYLRSKTNVSQGGDSVDVSDKVPVSVKKMAEDATKTIEGLNVCGLDMLIDEEYKEVVILEMNTKPMLGLHMFPMYGKPIDVVIPIVDFYFPSTINKDKSNLYFDFDSVITPLRDQSVTSLELTAPPILHNAYSKKYVITGESQSEFRKEVRLLALKHSLNGHIKVLEEDQLELIIAGEDIHAINAFMAQVYNIEETTELDFEAYEYNLPIKVGFEVEEISRHQKIIALQKEDIKNLSKDVIKEEKSKRKLEKDIKQEKTSKRKLEKDIKLERKSNQKFKKDIKDIKEEIIGDRRQNSIMGKRILDLEKNNRRLLLKNERQSSENFELLKERKDLMKSSSWKLTRPLRKINSFVKKN